jgi:hypothetical protein
MLLSFENIDSLNRGKLAIEVDNLAFFHNNEYNSTVQKGYTLPGFILDLKSVYYPLSNLKLELGAHSLWFWGARRYPAFAYKDVSSWQGQDYAHNVHVLPFYRVHLSLSKYADIILGDIYGGANHRLIEPLYNPELNLTSDPEAGLQFLFNTDHLKSDIWIDWVTYIYKLDTHEEAFISGLSEKWLFNNTRARVHYYLFLQGVLQHRGGEIDTATGLAQTNYNGAVGIGLTWNLNYPLLRRLNMESSLVGYTSMKSKLSALTKGAGQYAKISAQLNNFNFITSFWQCRNFVSLFGNPFYGAVSTKLDGMQYLRPQMLSFAADYVRPLAKGFSFAVNAQMFYFISGKMYSSSTGDFITPPFGNNANFSIGITVKINPSFFITYK